MKYIEHTTGKATNKQQAKAWQVNFANDFFSNDVSFQDWIQENFQEANSKDSIVKEEWKRECEEQARRAFCRAFKFSSR